LIELLVVIGIIAVLVGLLIPTVAAARRAAKNTVCAARLHDLVAATTMYFNDNRKFPLPPELPAFGGPVPLALQDQLLNAIGGVYHWPALDYTTRVDQLPEPPVCPCRLEVELLLEPYPASAFGAQWWNTGYSYCAGLTESRSTAAIALAPDRLTSLTGRRRGVLWSDNLVLLTIGGAPGGYAYFHFRGSHDVDPTFLTIIQPKTLCGLHRAWTDGSVEWLPRDTFDLSPAKADQQAAYKVVGPSGLGLYFYF
jgi:type II secretory pathway pseudopilin PulG